ncbi:relaxase/mobilization nuclease domain-containing protein [Caballeronia sp. KNU42]
MPLPKRYVDDILLNWGDRLFFNGLRRPGARQGGRPRPGGALRLRAQIVRTVRNVPEVMLKITNRRGGRNGMQAIRAHLLYVSRNGRVELENQDGDAIHGKEDVNDLVREWSRSGRGIPEQSRKREALNLMFSMPPGTDRQAVRDAARAFARAEFGGNFSYVFAAHDDEAHPHVHLCVQMQGRDGTRLNPRKADLQRWREGFARSLREYGVEANATPRRTRGVTRRYASQAVVHMRERGIAKGSPSSPPTQAVVDGHQPVLEAWWAIGRALAASDDPDDRQLALDVTGFVQQMPVTVSRPHQRDHPDVPSRSNQKPDVDVHPHPDDPDPER